MKKLFTLFIVVLCLVSFSSFDADAQTFTCTDLVFCGDDLSPSEKQKKIERNLGKKAYITFYDNSIRAVIYDYYGKNDNVLNKISSNRYEKKYNGDRMIIEFNTLFGYIRSFKMYGYVKSKIVVIATYRRE